MTMLSALAPKEGAKHYQKRLGRGKGSGLGQTSGKGGKGQTARSGGKIRRGFEGGQTPLMRRLPKFGFNNSAFGTEYSVVNVEQLNGLTGEITPQIMKEKGLVHFFPVKVLGKGALKAALTIKAHAFSATAKSAIEKAGGKTEIVKG